MNLYKLTETEKDAYKAIREPGMTLEVRWDTDLMERCVFAITSFSSQQHNDLLFIAVEIDKAQERGNQGLADVNAEKFFELFKGWLFERQP